MSSPKERLSEGADPEDLPSDFFDDFTKDDFMEGLSVIDSWADDDNSKRRINAETLNSVADLRELIDGKEDDKLKKGKSDRKDTKYKPRKDTRLSDQHARTDSGGKLDDYIKPGSRRDPSKTNEAIKKDKEVKVKELLAKHLDDDLRPPGTELDDYYNDGKPVEKKKLTTDRRMTPVERRMTPVERMKTPVTGEEGPPRTSRRRSREHRQLRESPLRHRRSPRRSPRRDFRRSPLRHRQFSPVRKFRRFSPHHSPPRRSPRRFSPSRRSPRHTRRSRSPLLYRPRYSPRRSRSPRPRDTFLYPNDPSSGYPSSHTPYSEEPYPTSNEYPSGYSYPQGAQYTYSAPGYEYGVQQSAPIMPQPVPAPLINTLPSASIPVTPVAATAPPLRPLMSIGIQMTPAPAMVPPPSQIISPSAPNTSTNSQQPFDALAQLVADGKLSQQDYLKLAPSKSVNNSLDTKARVLVLNRCNTALSKLSRLLLPNRLMMNHSIIGQEPKYLTPKYCSPLKRQANIEFQFTKSSGATTQQNKTLVDSIIATVGLDKVVARPKKKIAKDMKDAAVQTSRPYCDVCEVRESTKFYDASTSIDREHLCESIHTQVVEQDLINSKAIFNPTGSSGDNAPMSIAHMTPAQLVSQLAARAKTLKQTPDPVPPPHNQYGRRNPPYDNRGQFNDYQNYNYRY